MRIGEVAAAAGVSVRSVRYYEEQGLLTADRSAGGQRTYTEAAVERVRFIQRLYAAGLSSSTVAGLIPCVYTDVATPEMIERLQLERYRIQGQVEELLITLDRLDNVITIALDHAAVPARQGTD